MPTAEEVEPKVRIGQWVFGKAVPGEGEKPEQPVKYPDEDDKEEVQPDPPRSPSKMPKRKAAFTDITIILDRSGSMGAIREATVKSINDYMRSVDEVPGDGCWSLYTFDDRGSATGSGEAFPYCNFVGQPTARRPMLELQDYNPRGGTALVDAVFTVIGKAKDRLKEETGRKVLVVIVTDGQENSSCEHTREHLRSLIASCIKDGWDFLYLGANQDSFTESAGYGMASAAGAGTSPYFSGMLFNWQPTAGGVAQCFADNAAGSATVGTRNWKCDGNQSAAALQGDGLPDAVQAVENAMMATRYIPSDDAAKLVGKFDVLAEQVMDKSHDR